MKEGFEDDAFLGSLSVPIDCDGVHFFTKFEMCATINRTGTQTSDHYWCYVRDLRDKKWCSCDDETVKSVSPDTLNNSSGYLFFYQRK